MCCIYGFITWSLSCIQRSLTFVLGFWVMVMILYALALGLSAGVAFGYDYGLAEYKTLARPDVQFTMRPRVYVPEVLARRSGNVAGILAIGEDEYQQKTGRYEALGQETYEYTPPTLWLYGLSRKSSQRNTPTVSAIGNVKMTKPRKIIPLEEEDTYIMQEANEMFVPRKVKPVSSKTNENVEYLNVRPLISSIPKLQRPDSNPAKSISTYPKLKSTFPKSKSTPPKLESTPLRLDSTSARLYSTSLKLDSTVPRLYSTTPILDSTSPRLGSTSSKLDSTSPRLDLTSPILDSTSPRSDSTSAKIEVRIRASTSRSPSTIMRIFKPRSTYLKWRPTKPNKKFFYKTLAASHGSKTTPDSYIPKMEIRTYRTKVNGKYERLPIRYWDATGRRTEPTERSEEVNDYKNIIYF